VVLPRARRAHLAGDAPPPPSVCSVPS